MENKIKKAKKSKDPNKVNHSVFMITINTNKHLDEKNTQTFENSIKFWMATPKVYEYLVEKTPGGVFDPNKIVKIKTKYSIEVGKLQSKTHAHALIEVDHKMMLGVNLAKLRSFYKNLLGTNIHLDVKARGNNLKSWEEYMFKDAN
jgi:hypothetical protein